MQTLVEEFSGSSDALEADPLIAEAKAELTVAETDALRVFRSLLFGQDSAKSFGGLRRVQSPSGDFLWVCSDHYAEYDPGLPEIPGARSWHPH
jgi:hypothetical protein